MDPREKVAHYVELLIAKGAEKHPERNHYIYALSWVEADLQDLYAYSRGLCDALTEERGVMETSIAHAALRVFLDKFERRFGEMALKVAREEQAAAVGEYMPREGA